MSDSHEYIASLDDVKIGKNVLESLTRSAYDDCRCILREYVQNAADQIDIAKEQHLSDKDDYGIYINIDSDAKRIEIEDNATGVISSEILPVLRNVACSQKSRNKRKGFRGIGRLGGLGYCKTLTFITSFKGESIKSILRWNADEMKRIIDDENDERSAGEVVSAVTELRVEKETADCHYFKVIMEDVNDNRLLDIADIRDYISMVAPVEISNTFSPFKTDIAKFVADHNLTLDTYDVYVNGEQVYKQYTRSILGRDGSEVDKVQKVEFFIRNDKKGNPFYWGWYSICNLKGIIDSRNVARGIRLRCKNIQLGGETNCRRFLPGKQDERFSDYFFGEIHTISNDLIPDMDRNYLRVDDARTEFENMMMTEEFVYLKDLCYTASGQRSDVKKVATANAMQEKLEKKKKEHKFSSEEELKKAEEDFEIAKAAAEKAKQSMEKRKQAMVQNGSPLIDVFNASDNFLAVSSNTQQNDANNEYDSQSQGENQLNDNLHYQPSNEDGNGYLRTSKPEYKSFDKKSLEIINTVYKIIGEVLPIEEMRDALIDKIEKELTK